MGYLAHGILGGSEKDEKRISIGSGSGGDNW